VTGTGRSSALARFDESRHHPSGACGRCCASAQAASSFAGSTRSQAAQSTSTAPLRSSWSKWTATAIRWATHQSGM